MPEQTERGALPSKLYFRIGEVAGLVGVEPHVLRYWEREFRSIRPTKSAKGQRVYSRRDVESLLRVRELLYGQGFTIAGARRRLRDKDAVEPAEPDGESPREAAPGSHPGHAPTLPAPALAQRPAVPAVETIPDGTRLRVRRELEALKSEVEAFLVELGGAP
jgi:DNA-binding transcriptional MerR regulator